MEYQDVSNLDRKTWFDFGRMPNGAGFDELSGDQSVGARLRPRPLALGPTLAVHGRPSHRQQGRGSPSSPDGSVATR
jgi:hypothetical protein